MLKKYVIACLIPLISVSSLYAKPAGNLSKRSVNINGYITHFPVCKDYAILSIFTSVGTKLERINLNTLTAETVYPNDNTLGYYPVDCDSKNSNFYAITTSGGVSAYETSNLKKPIWQQPPPANSAFVDLKVADNIVVLVVANADSRSLQLQALDASSGKAIWQAEIPAMVVGLGKVHILKDNDVYIETYDTFFKYDLHTGKQLWSFKSPNQQVTGIPSYDKSTDTLIVQMSSIGLYSGYVFGLDPANGEIKWKVLEDSTSSSLATNNAYSNKFAFNSSLIIKDNDKRTASSYRLYETQANGDPIQRAGLVFPVQESLLYIKDTMLFDDYSLISFKSNVSEEVKLYDDVGILLDTLQIDFNSVLGMHFSEKPSKKWMVYSMTKYTQPYSNVSEFGILNWNK